MRITHHMVQAPVLLLMALVPTVRAQTPQGTTFTYNGRLSDAIAPSDGLYDFEFRLFDDDDAGSQVGSTITADDLSVVAKEFTQDLDFGSVFKGDTRWLEIRVRPPGDSFYTVLSPRQKLTAVPYSLGLRLPWTATVSTSSGAFGVVNNGSGDAAQFEITNSQSAGDAVQACSSAAGNAMRATNSGTGRAAHFRVDNPESSAVAVEIDTNGNSSSDALNVVHEGKGDAGYFEITNSASEAEAVEARTSGTGDAVRAVNTGKGRAGYFKVDNAASSADAAVEIDSNGSTALKATVTGAGSVGSFVLDNSASINDAVLITTNATDSDENALKAVNTGNGHAIEARSNGSEKNTILAINAAGGPAASFDGDVSINGNLTKSSGLFRIDHPLDPANKFLQHSFVESPDMMNVYNGNIATDEAGYAVVILPEWFEALNGSFRYQLTVIGQFASAIVAEKIQDNRFVIRTDKPFVEVSWQVTGIRRDAWADAHRIQVEVDKADHERGQYLHPEAFGLPRSMRIEQ